ncbi:hypothetical protein R3P38DRAFT_2831284 [Favolaschia claudopus]|uniref:Uncharacterized protein n=1 Tax=Favolaschia claudopus TaxID=2862362 RepID=A0AAW0EDJ0_9AGAR
MDDSPPPAYSQEYRGPVIDPAVASQSVKGSAPNHSSKRAEGRDALTKRPLPRPPQRDVANLIAAPVSPLRLHKKSQSTAIPSTERSWRPTPADGSTWGAPNPPQFLNREAEHFQSPHHMRSPPPMLAPPEYGRSVPNFPTPNRTNQMSAAPIVDPNAFYNPAVSGHLSRVPIPLPQSRPPRMDARPNQASSNPPQRGHVRWA